MNPMMMGLIGGGASLLGSIFSGVTSASNTQEQIQASMQEQATQNAFTEQMSNTAYQRASKDMTAAGLNPAMMFGSGSAASTPSGSSIQAPMPQTQSPLAGLGKAADSIVSTAVQAKTFDKMSDEIANLQAEAAERAARTRTEEEKPALVRAETDVEKERRLNVATDTQSRAAEMPASRVKGLTSEAIESMPAWLRDNAVRAGFVGGKASDALAPFFSTARAVGAVAKGYSDSSFRNRYYFGE